MDGTCSVCMNDIMNCHINHIHHKCHRYAVWLQGVERTSEAADQVLERAAPRIKMEPMDFKRMLFGYATKQAENDDRIKNYSFNTFFFVVSYGPIQAEGPHLKGQEPDARFTLESPRKHTCVSPSPMGPVFSRPRAWPMIQTVLQSSWHSFMANFATWHCCSIILVVG